MKRISLPHFWLAVAASALFGGLGACGSDLGLPPATITNRVDTVTIFALRGTEILEPSGFDMIDGLLVRTDRGAVFDLAFDIDSMGRALIYPAGALKLPGIAGVQRRNETFDRLVEAPRDDYVIDSALVVTTGLVFAARSRSSSQLCVFLGSLPRYGKFHVLAIDVVERSITLELLLNLNCGFRSLEPGIPTS